jgi:ABC-type uncharacterized transport system ATPase subunit
MDYSFYESTLNRVQFLDGVHEDKKARRNSTVTEIAKLKKEKDILDKTEKVLKHLTDKLVRNDLTKMDNLVTYGLRTVYSNRNFQFRSEVQERGRKMWIELQTINDGNLTDPQAKSSVHVVESFLLRILCLIKTKRARLLLLDETFAAVDSEYIENLYQLVSELCKKLSMDVLLVTHFPGFSEIVDHSYKLTGIENKTEVIQTK